jgi:hypothetical protein
LVLDRNVFDPTVQPLGMDYKVLTAGQCRIMVYNIAAEQVVKILDQFQNVGNYRTFWDGKNRNGEITGNAVYFVVIQTPDGSLVRKVIVLK